MTYDEYERLFWRPYLLLEKEFSTTVKYIAIDPINFVAYSSMYAKIILQIGSEVDVTAKTLCREIDNSFSGDGINIYEKIIENRFTEFNRIEVSCGDIEIYPWAEWSSHSPFWWTAYNKIKHNRTEEIEIRGVKQECYKFANQEIALNALAGLFQLEQYIFRLIEHDPHLETPIPGSRLFKLKGKEWDNKRFEQDIFFFTNDEGCLCSLSSDVSYADM